MIRNNFHWQTAEKRPSAAFPLSFVIAAYVCQVRFDWHFLGPQDFVGLREAASAKAGEPCIWAFLSSPKNSLFQQPASVVFLKQLDVLFLIICLLGQGAVLFTQVFYIQITPAIHETLHYRRFFR
jgi:hypothetical protein